MKGVKYNLSFRLPNGEYEQVDNLPMNQLIDTIKQKVISHYSIVIKMSNHIIYNLQYRNNVNPFLKSIVKIEKSVNLN